jgi:hypothetical protein
MTDDNSAWLENVLGGQSGEEKPDIRDARCPKCGAADFAPISDLYTDSVVRLEDGGQQSPVASVGGMTDAQIVREFAPPTRKSAPITTLIVAVPVAAAAFYVYRRFEGTIGQIAVIVAGILVIATFLTRTRAYSDKYYEDRRRWNHLFMCRKCGQRVHG